MPDPLLSLDPAVKDLTVGLVSYLREYLKSIESQIRDGIADADVFWLEDAKPYITASGLDLPCPPSAGAPAPPGSVRRWLTDEDAWRAAEGPEPHLSADADDQAHAQYDRWLPDWRQWAAEDQPNQQLRARYTTLDNLRRKAADLSDTHELVLGAGLLTVARRGRWTVRRHLLVRAVTVIADPSTERLHVELASTLGWEVEDRDFLTADDGFVAGRSSIATPAGLGAGEGLREWLEAWRQRNWAADMALDTDRWAPSEDLSSDVAELAIAPALLLRPRSQGGLLRMYDAIASQLSRQDQPLPLALANLVAPAKQSRVTELAYSGLYPLPSNREQRRILENLRTDTAVVVQGPPGTGKTHTIANLICALLADGQRVLITSQKEQALRVLRDQLPPEIRQLCVLMTGMQGSGTDELNRSLIALSELLATVDQTQLEHRIDKLQRRRQELSERIGNLTAELGTVRMQEYLQHGVPGGDQPPVTVAETAQFIVDGQGAHDWIGTLPYGAAAQSPLTDEEARELLQLLRSDSLDRTRRCDQEIPGPDDLPTPSRIAAAVTAVAEGNRILGTGVDDDAWAVAELDDDALAEICGQVEAVSFAMTGCGLTEVIANGDTDDWRTQAVQALLRRQDVAYWNTLFDDAVAVTAHDAALAAIADRDVEVQAGPGTTVTPRRLLQQALALRKYVSAGGRISRLIRPKPVLQAADLLSSCTVNGLPPENAVELDAVIISLRAEIAVSDAAEAWAEAGARLAARPLRRRIAQFKDIAAAVTAIRRLVSGRDAIDRLLRRRRVRYDVGSADRWDLIVRIAHAVPQLRQARFEACKLAEFDQQITSWAQKYRAAGELPLLLAALRDRNIEAFSGLFDELEQARADQCAGRRLLEMTQRLSKAHPTLVDHLRSDPHAQEWDLRLGNLQLAWAWGYAHQWYEDHRDASVEKIQERGLDEAEQLLQAVIRELAGCQAVLQCVRRTTPDQRRALQEYRSAIASYGRGTSEYKARYLRAAREAMDKARGAVPAWVMPLEEVANNIPARPDLFDVVIVDEASQAPVKSLFLLWLAPRIVVVGDEEQCTPHASTATDLGSAYEILDRHLAKLDTAERHTLGPNSNLYELMSARAAETIRLSEHFRSMPEIIEWSSGVFYGHRLVPLRQFGADRLEPLKVVQVPNAEEKYRDKALRNEAEAYAIVDQVERLIADPRNRERTIGVVVMQNCYQIQLIDAELRKRVSRGDLERFKIRVGNPPDFQGEERNIILLSLVATNKRVTQRAPSYRRHYNVAASRARDQMWLFTSMDMTTLDPTDLRYRLYQHMLNPPDRNAPDPALDLANHDDLREPFESIVQQRIFLELRARGFVVIPQYAVDAQRIDFLVVGEHGRLAVECDGPSVPRTQQEIAEDIARERELRRSDWRIVRIRESEFILDPQAALQPLWGELHERGIKSQREAKKG